MRTSFDIHETYFLSLTIVSLLPFHMTLDNRSGIDKNPVAHARLHHCDSCFSDLPHLCPFYQAACAI